MLKIMKYSTTLEVCSLNANGRASFRLNAQQLGGCVSMTVEELTNLTTFTI